MSRDLRNYRADAPRDRLKAKFTSTEMVFTVVDRGVGVGVWHDRVWIRPADEQRRQVPR